MTNVALPLTAEESVSWDEAQAGAEVEMLIEGVLLTSASDMTRAFPTFWPNLKAAQRCLQL